MAFFEFIWMFSLTILLPLAIIKMTMDYKRQQAEAQNEANQAGLTLGELKRIVRDTVDEANAPLLERLDRLEKAGMLDGVAEEPLIEQRERTVGRQTVS